MRRKPVAVSIAIAMLLLPSLTPIPLVAAVLLATVSVVATGCLRLGELQRSIRLDVILLLGSLTSFSVAMQSTGLADSLALVLQQGLEGWPSYAALMVIFIGTTLLTQVMSNAASVALLAPVAVQLAPSLQMSPTALLITVLFGASQSFLTPVGYQTNLMVFGPGRYRFLDVTRYGLGLTAIMTVLVPALILWHTADPEQHRSDLAHACADRKGHRTQPGLASSASVPQFTVVTGLLVVLIGTLLLATPLCSSSSGLGGLVHRHICHHRDGATIIDIGTDLTSFGQAVLALMILAGALA